MKLPTIEVLDTFDNEDGSCTMSFDLDSESIKEFATYGVKFILYCAAYGISTERAFDRIAGRIEG
jgi:hypothetical protein